MMSRSIRAAFCCCACALSASAGSTSFVEDFSNGNDEANWMLLTTSGQTFVAQSGGNPGAFLTHTQSSWPAPVVRTNAPDSVFTGDYRAAGVEKLGLDMAVFLVQAQLPHPDFTMTVMLGYDNGTPGFLDDDTRVFFNDSGAPIPTPADGWLTYEFEIPSQADPAAGELPPGWAHYDDGFGTVLDNHTWREVMENVTEVWFLGAADPAAIGFFWNWITGVDNIRLEAASAIPGDLNGDGVVNGADLASLLANWGDCAKGEPCPADLNGDGLVNGADLATLLANWGVVE